MLRYSTAKSIFLILYYTFTSLKKLLIDMNNILNICEWCVDTFGYTLGLVLLFIFFPVIVSVAILLFMLAIPIGIIYKAVKLVIH